MKKLMIISAVALIGAAVMAAQQTLTIQDGTKTGGAGMISKVNANFTEVYGGLTTNGLARLVVLETLAVTNATITQQKAVITATAAVTPQTYVIPAILADGTTNTVASMTNGTVAITVLNGSTVVTNISINLNP